MLADRGIDRGTEMTDRLGASIHHDGFDRRLTDGADRLRPLRRAAVLALGLLLVGAAASAEGRTCTPIRYTPTEPDQIARAEVWTRFVASTLVSSDLRLRVSAPIDAFARCDDGELVIAEDPGLPALIELARGSTDPMILATLIARCTALNLAEPAACDAPALADRWTIVDSQNAAAWLAQAEIRRQRGDRDGAGDSVRRALAAPTWHEYDVDRERVLLQAIPKDAAPDDTLLLVARATHVFTRPHLGTQSAIIGLCLHAVTRDACTRLLDLVYRDATEESDLRLVDFSIAWSNASDEVVRTRQERAGAVAWARHIALERIKTTVDPDQRAQASIALSRRWVEVGEVRSALDLLAAERIAEPDAARRYEATLDPQFRATMLSLRGMTKDDVRRTPPP
jgi:hypothetical protein